MKSSRSIIKQWKPVKPRLTRDNLTKLNKLCSILYKPANRSTNNHEIQ